MKTTHRAVVLALAFVALPAQAQQPVKHTHSELPFRFDAPAGFAPFPDALQTPDDLYAFIHGDRDAPEGAVALLVQRTRGTIARRPQDLSLMPPEMNATREPALWQGLPVEVIRTFEDGRVAFAVQLPLRPEAIQSSSLATLLGNL
jgi:hypothetical protein